MKPHCPVWLFKSLCFCASFAVPYSLYIGVPVKASTLVLDSGSIVAIDYADDASIASLNSGTLQLMGGTTLLLSNCGELDGRVYTLFTGVTQLLDAAGNAIILDSDSNAAEQYFDTTRTGTGFWADSRLQLSSEGNLQLVRHVSGVKEAEVVSIRQTDSPGYQYYSSVEFDGCGAWQKSGGALFVEGSKVISLNNNGKIIFNDNAVNADKNTYGAFPSHGGAIYAEEKSTIALQGNGLVSFSGNNAHSDAIGVCGGAICGARESSIELSDNGSVEFIGNICAVTDEPNYTQPSSYGGAIYGAVDSKISLTGNGSVVFRGNKATNVSSGKSYGGAIFGENGSIIELCNNGSVELVENEASDAGAISGGTIMLKGNEKVYIAQNTSGAISGSLINLSDNGNMTFSKNTLSYFYSDSYAKPASVTAVKSGGALNGASTLKGNGILSFKENIVDVHASSYQSATSYARGGAVQGSTLISGNKVVEFTGNEASAYANSKDYYSDYEYSYSYGGAICGETVDVRENTNVEFKENKTYSSAQNSYAYGGAIYSEGSVSIVGNGEVTFARNCEQNESTYRLRSIYVRCNNSTDTLILSAKKGGHITFYDSVYMGKYTDAVVSLNAEYKDANDVTQKATGDIVFSGKLTETHLKDIKGGTAGTTTEIANSRTSELLNTVNLYGGTLRVEDKAVLKTHAINVVAGSNATLKVANAEVNAGGYDVTVNKTAQLMLEGVVTDGAVKTALLRAGNVAIVDEARLTVKCVTTNSGEVEESALFTLDTTRGTGYDASRAYNLLAGGQIDADLLTLSEGSVLDMQGVHLAMSSGELTLAVTSVSTAKRIELNLTLSADYDPNAQVVLFSDVNVVNFLSDGITAKSTDGVVYTLAAADYFGGAWITGATTLVYDTANKVVYLEGIANVPEPTTSLLGLVGMVALSFRRRRASR